MKSTIIDYRQIFFENESDVEQKFLYALLTTESPMGLGYSTAQIKTKPNIRKLMIDKGSSAKIYFPDYAILVDSLPVLILEAKHPGEDIDNAYREARLYAHEINATFSSNTNPCAFIIVSDGKRTYAGKWDSTPTYFLEQTRYDLADTAFWGFIDEFAAGKLAEFAMKVKSTYRGNTKFLKPTHMLGGRAIRSKSIGENSFGVNLALEYKYLFNPESEEERKRVIQNAYVESKRHMAHISPIDRLIRASIAISDSLATDIELSKRPVEIFRQVQNKTKVRKQICLLIGSVGAGKSTFVQYLREKALPKDLLADTHWLSIDLNAAPVSKERIYSWIVNTAIEQLRNSRPDLDFDDISFIQKIFARELQALKKGPLTILKGNPSEYERELYKSTMKLLKNRDDLLRAIICHLFDSRNILLICVLDNCDKRSRDEQLLMFEVANWLRTKYNLMVFLPLRETTYDIYRNEPPLDTVIKDLVFRIEPPLLIQVIQKRIEYAYREISNDQSDFCYYLSNSMAVHCKRNEIENYLKVMLYCLFESDLFRKLMIGLSGRNIRMGLEIFLDFCKSGHLSEDDILRMRTAKELYLLPNHLITRIMLRGTRVYYDETASRIKNIFHSEFSDTIPDPFVRLSILDWFRSRYSLHGPTMIKGYHRISDLTNDLTSLGHAENVIIRELERLLTYEYVISETQEFTYDPDSLARITPAGNTLLDLINNLDYLATISEDSLFRNNDAAKAIADNISGLSLATRFSKQNAIESAMTFIEYLMEYKKTHWVTPSAAVMADRYSPDNDTIDEYLASSRQMIQNVRANHPEYLSASELKQRYPIGSIHDGHVVSIQPYGLIIEMGLNASGLVHITSLSNRGEFIDVSGKYEVGQWVRVKILRFEDQLKKFALAIVESD